jgi:hypothetical protein
VAVHPAVIRPWRDGSTVVASALVAWALLTGPLLGIAAAEDGLRVASESVYVLEDGDEVVRVRVAVTLSNTTQDQVTPEGVVATVWNRWTIPVPATAQTPRATVGSRPATVSLLGRDAQVAVATVELPRPLRGGETTVVVLTYELAGGPPRSPGWVRVNPAYAAFPAWSVADPGRASVRIELPAGHVVDTIGPEVRRSEVDGSVVIEQVDIADPLAWSLVVTARRDDRLVPTRVATGVADVELRSWPGDGEWSDYVAGLLAEGLPRLADLVGLPWPLDGDLTMVQASTPYLFGYAGWFRIDDRVIEVGERLDARVVLHELAHAWFNNGLLEGRWINEGLAEEYAARTLAGMEGSEPAAPAPLDPDDPYALPLEQWRTPSFGSERAGGVEAYGYAASWWVVRAIVEEIGFERMAAVVRAAAGGGVSYAGEGPPEAAVQPRDWRRFLDLLEQVGGSASAESHFRDLVLAEDDRVLLDRRGAALARYGSLLERGGPWAAPLGVRVGLGAWDFPGAVALIDGAESVLDVRDASVPLAERLDVRLPAGLEEGYESATDAESLDVVAERAAAQLSALETVDAAATAEAGRRSLVERVGLWFSSPEEELAAAKAAIEAGDPERARAQAEATLDRLDGAGRAGTLRLLIAAGVVLVLVAMVLIVAGRRRRARGHGLSATSSG